MSPWTHNLCPACWKKMEPGWDPVTMDDMPQDKCCVCGVENSFGIYWREDPAKMPCKGLHEFPALRHNSAS